MGNHKTNLRLSSLTTETISTNTFCELILQYDFSKQINSDVQTGQGAAHITLIWRFARICVLPYLELHLFSAYQKITIIFRGVEKRNSNNDNNHINNCNNEKGNNNKIIVSEQCKGKGLFTVHILRHCICHPKLTTNQFNWAHFVKISELKFLSVHVMTAYGWRRETDPLVLNLGTDGGECKASPSGRFNHGERNPCTHWIGGTNNKFRVRECEVTVYV